MTTGCVAVSVVVVDVLRRLWDERGTGTGLGVA